MNRDGQMQTDTRRKQIIEKLKKTDKPVSASALAKEYAVSRQIIVGDIALLRAAGYEIEATARGYVIPGKNTGIIRRIACSHTAEQMKDELYAIIDQGCVVEDVIIEHPVYNELRGSLRLASRYDVDCFTERCSRSEAKPLSALTEGIHLHTLSCPSEEAFARVSDSLRKQGILIEN